MRILKIIYEIIYGWIYWAAFITGGNFIRKAFFKSCGKGVKISPTAFFKSPRLISIGSNSFINHNCSVWAAPGGSIAIGNDVLFGPGVSVISSNHGVRPAKLIREQDDEGAPIDIGNDVWIGANVVITAGTRIGDGCVVGAGAVVTKDLPARSICVGIPAQVVRYREVKDQ